MFVGKPCFIALLSFVLGFAIGEVDRSVSYNAKCSKFHIRKSTIIKTQQSIHDGAEFLGKKVTTSSRGCHKQCCSTLGCNLVMLKYDVESSVERVNCFMFNCRSPSVCSFFKHPSYHSYAALEYVSEDGGKTQDNEEYHKVETTTEPVYPTSAEKGLETSKHNGWEKVNWFKVFTTSKPKLVPIYKKTDYDDNSHMSMEKQNWLNKQAVEKITTKDSFNHKTSSTQIGNHWDIGENKYKNTNSYDSSKFGTYDHTEKFKMPTVEANEGDEVDEEEDFPRRVFVDNNPDFPDPPHKKPEPQTEKPVEKKPTEVQPQEEKPTEVQPQEEKPTEVQPQEEKPQKEKPPEGKPNEKPPLSHTVPIKTIVIRDFQGNKAVIPLAIGLVLALLLLLGIIFRLKTSRRRRTKAFLTDDADYLINGMYL